MLLQRKQTNYNVVNQYSFVTTDGISFRFRDQGFQMKKHIGKFGDDHVAFESPILSPLEAASLSFPIQSIIEYPVQKLNIGGVMFEQTRPGHCFKVIEEETDRITETKCIGETFNKTFSSPLIEHIVKAVLTHGSNYIVCPKLDGSVAHVEFSNRLMYISQKGKDVIVVEISNQVKSKFCFLAELIDRDVILFDVCINTTFGYRMDILKSLPICKEFKIQTFTCVNVELCQVELPPTKYPTDGIIVSFATYKHQFKYKPIDTVDLFVTPTHLNCDECPLIVNTMYQQYIGFIIEIDISGKVIKIRHDKEKPNSFFTVYCCFSNIIS